MEDISSKKNLKSINKKKRDAKFALIAGFVFAIMTLINVLPNKNANSDFDNQEISPFKMDGKDWLDGKAEQEFENYINSKFVLGDSLKSARKSVATILGQHEYNGVLKGSDGYLIDIFDKPDDEIFDKQLRAINTFARDYSSNIYTSMVIVPTKSEVYKSKMPLFGFSDDESKYIDKYYNNLENVSLIDLRDVFKEHIAEDIFYKTDNTWTSLGSYYAYNEIASELRLDVSDDKYESQAVDKEFVGNLAYKSGYNKYVKENIYIYFNEHTEFGTKVTYKKDLIKPTMYNKDALKTNSKLNVFLGEPRPIIKIDSTCMNDENLLIIGDEYMKQIAPFMAGQYQSVYLMDANLYKHNISKFIKKNKITNVLFLFGATNLSKCQNLIKIME